MSRTITTIDKFTKTSPAGFSAIRRSPKRIIMSVQGPRVKCGKTYLGLTGPKPVGLISVEVGGAEGVTDSFIPAGQEFTDDIQGVEIYMNDPVYPDPNLPKKAYDEQMALAAQDVATEALNKFYAAYYESLENFKLTIVDTGPDLWEIVRLATFGKLEKVAQLQYQYVNSIMDKIIEDAYKFPGSVIFTHHMAEKWEQYTDPDTGKSKGRATGIMEPTGYKGMSKKVQAVVEVWREDLKDPNENTGRMVKFHAEIRDSRHNPDCMGQQFTDDDITFANIAKHIVAGTKLEDWL